MLSKSEYLEYRDCAKSLWLKRNRPEAITWSAPTLYDRLLMAQGYEVEREAVEYLRSLPHGNRLRFQVAAIDPQGLTIRIDALGERSDGLFDLIEIKSSTSIKEHLIDVCFQKIIAERAGLRIASVSILHIDREYVRQGALAACSLFTTVDVTDEVAALEEEVSEDIDCAMSFLAQRSIDEVGCSCRTIGRARHCQAFAHFNHDIGGATAYMLPRISASRLEKLDSEGRLHIDDVTPDDVTAKQLPVLNALQSSTPVINSEAVRAFVSGLSFPLHFYDYETFASAIPKADGLRPHMPMPVQFSLHVLEQDGSLSHYEHLSDGHDGHERLVDCLRAGFADEGHAIVWNEPFEKGCNTRLADMLPAHSDFLQNVNERTVDLMVLFKEDYVDPGFEGSVSIKKVLPILCPDLTYEDGEVSDGAGAMAAFTAMLDTECGDRRAKIRKSLLDYCELDTLAMVRIFQFLAKE